MTALSVSEKRLAAAIEPWFGEDAGTVAILLAVFHTPESRAGLARQLATRLDDPAALLAAINGARVRPLPDRLQASDSKEQP